MNWQDEAAILKFQDGKSWGDLYRHFPEHKPETIRGALRRMPGYKEHTTKCGKVDFMDLPNFSAGDTLELWATFEKTQKLIDRSKFVQSEAVIPIHDDKPIGIVQTGDWHIGCIGFDFETFNADMETFETTDGLYLIDAGDGINNDNPLIHPKSNTTDQMDRQMQLDFYKHFSMRLSDKWLARTLGCHVDWDIKTSGKDPIESLCREMKKPYLKYGGTLYIELNGIEYSWMVRHKYRSESKINTTNAQRVMADSFGKRDVVSLAHLHFPDLAAHIKEGEQIIYLRSGSYKVGDEFGREIGGYRGTPVFPMVILFPDRKRAIPFRDYREGLYMLKELRK
jgi:hypothetical protein